MIIRYARFILLALTGLALLGLGIYVGSTWKSSYATQKSSNASVVLERIQDIHEMALVEAHFSEVYDYKDYWGFDLSPFRKKAIILVEGQVKAGIDLNTLMLDWNDETRTLTIDSIPACSILSIDHDLRYYDIQEGSFNAFDASTLSELQKGAKAFLASKAVDKKILEEAEKRKLLFLSEVRDIIEDMGWTLVIKDTTSPVKG